MFERYSFVAITTSNLARAREFWVSRLGLPVSEEQPGEFFIVDAGGLRLCVDLPDGQIHKAGSTDPILGLKVARLEPVLAELSGRGVRSDAGITSGARGRFAVIHDPDGRVIVLTEGD
jgi:catechol 2,3-dioxygenase-like lactoylglutathione lyase family enzyme